MAKCFACNRKLGKNPYVAVTGDGQRVNVGSQCYKLIGPEGYQPPMGGPKLFRGKFSGDGTLKEIIRPDPQERSQ